MLDRPLPSPPSTPLRVLSTRCPGASASTCFFGACWLARSESSSDRVKELSFTDDLTRLYNRRFFATRLEDEVSRYSRFNRAVSVVMLGIDGFKAVNDELGHVAGDETLRTVGNVLQRQSRSMDVVCRYASSSSSAAGTRSYWSSG